VEPFRDPALPAGTVGPVGTDPAAEAARAEDSALAAACQAGDLRAYERLYALQGARMKNLARNLLGNPLDAEDAVQDTFLKVQRSIGSFRGQSSFVTWTFRILVNTCHDARRKRVRKKEVANEDETGESLLPELRAPSSHPALRLALERALAELRAISATFFCCTRSKASTIRKLPRCWKLRKRPRRIRFSKRRKIFAECLRLLAVATLRERDEMYSR
jgi:RNA polymerase sigma factor (sigma-70 family)